MNWHNWEKLPKRSSILIFASMLILGKTVNAFPQTDTRFWRVAPENSENHNDLPNGDRLVGRELTIENSWLNDSGTYTLHKSRKLRRRRATRERHWQRLQIFLPNCLHSQWGWAKRRILLGYYPSQGFVSYASTTAGVASSFKLQTRKLGRTASLMVNLTPSLQLCILLQPLPHRTSSGLW